MAWNEPEDPGKRPKRPPPAAGGWLARLRLDGGRHGNTLLAGLAAALVAGWLLTGLYKVEESERGALLRLGAFAGERGPGLGWHLPWPFEDVIPIDLGRLQEAGFQSRLFTADTALVNASFGVQYRVRELRTVLFGLRDAEATLRQEALAEARQAVAAQPLAALIGGGGRTALLASMRDALQADLDRLGAGISVQSIDLTDVQVPEAVLAAQREVNQAGEERTRQVREAEGVAADLVARSEGAAQGQRLEAEAYKLQVVGTAEGDAVRFEQLLPAYEKNPQVLRDRLYIETMETILARSRKLVIDGKGAGTTLNIPLDRMFDASAVRGTGVTGVLEEPATAAPAGAAGAVPSSTSATAPGAAPGAAAGAAVGGAAPAAVAAPAPAATPADRPSADRSRSRERETR